jgi:hypothetical protein
MSVKWGMARKSHARKQDTWDAAAAKHYKLRNWSAQTQALPRQYIRSSWNGTTHKPDFLVVVNTISNTAIPTITQKTVDVFEGDCLYTGTRKHQQDTCLE